MMFNSSLAVDRGLVQACCPPRQILDDPVWLFSTKVFQRFILIRCIAAMILISISPSLITTICIHNSSILFSLLIFNSLSWDHRFAMYLCPQYKNYGEILRALCFTTLSCLNESHVTNLNYQSSNMAARQVHFGVVVITLTTLPDLSRVRSLTLCGFRH